MYAAGAGTPTAGAVIGGQFANIQGTYSNTYLSTTNGISWTTYGGFFSSYVDGIYRHGASGTSQSNLCFYGGAKDTSGHLYGPINTTVSYDGTSFTTRASMNTARSMMGSSSQGSQSSALATSGVTGGTDAAAYTSLLASTEEFGNTL
jgi:hypothetical protein